MRILYEKAKCDPTVISRFHYADEATKAMMWHADDLGIFAYYWFSSLYVVIEGFRELRFQDEKIDKLLQSPNVDALRLMRNATFHFQKEDVSRKLMPIFESADSWPWVRSLTEEFSEFFHREITET
jgi:hypothetical protein